jgi:hypothetical protein
MHRCPSTPGFNPATRSSSRHCEARPDAAIYRVRAQRREFALLRLQ